jgi:outer membrane protein TolC
MSEEALLLQQRVALFDVERQVATDVALGALGVDRSAVALRDAEEAVALYRITVDNERRKLQLGMNTLFDVINSEDALTNALLAAINNRRAYATALASLRLATGTLADTSGELPNVDAAQLLTPP